MINKIKLVLIVNYSILTLIMIIILYRLDYPCSLYYNIFPHDVDKNIDSAETIDNKNN